MKELTNFNAIYCSGLLIPNQASVAAISLLFEKVYLPNNIELVVDFAKQYRINGGKDSHKGIKVEPVENDCSDDPFSVLNDEQKETAHKYLDWSMGFARANHALFDDVFESDAFADGNPYKVELIEQGKKGEKNQYRVSYSPMRLHGEDDESIPNLINKGYVPVVGNIHSKGFVNQFDANSLGAKQLAAILAMKSIEMYFPATEPVPADIILEAREKLSEHLPVYWSSMLKLSKELKPLVQECNSTEEVLNEGMELIDTVVRPALIDLNDKIEKERKQWFYRVFGRVYKGLKMAAGNPPVTQEQLLRSSLVLGADTAMGIANDFQKAEMMKSEAGLTYLLELGSLAKRT